MGKFFQYLSGLAFFLILSKPCVADPLDVEKTGSPLTMTLRVYNYARLPRWDLNRTSKQTARIFDEIGIYTSWVECPISEAEMQKFEDCLQPLRPTDVVLKIMPRFKSRREGFRDTVFGFAAGFQAMIALNRVEEMAKDGEAKPSQILTLVIAHEIGHVLLGSKSHSPNGIMRSQWNRKEFQRFTWESFRFTPEQVRKLRAELLLRIENKGTHD